MFKINTSLSTGATGYTWTIEMVVGADSYLIASSSNERIYHTAQEATQHAGELLANMLSDAFRAGLERRTI